jgi:hypothetical protein
MPEFPVRRPGPLHYIPSAFYIPDYIVLTMRSPRRVSNVSLQDAQRGPDWR